MSPKDPPSSWRAARSSTIVINLLTRFKQLPERSSHLLLRPGSHLPLGHFNNYFHLSLLRFTSRSDELKRLVYSERPGATACAGEMRTAVDFEIETLESWSKSRLPRSVIAPCGRRDRWHNDTSQPWQPLGFRMCVPMHFCTWHVCISHLKQKLQFIIFNLHIPNNFLFETVEWTRDQDYDDCIGKVNRYL